MAFSGLGPRHHPQIMAVPYPSLSPTTPTTLDLHQAQFGRQWQPLPQALVLTVSEGDNAPSGAGAGAGATQGGASVLMTGNVPEGTTDMEISDDEPPLPSSVSSCLQTHPPPPQEAHDFLSSLYWSPRGRAGGLGMRQSIAVPPSRRSGVMGRPGSKSSAIAPAVIGRPKELLRRQLLSSYSRGLAILIKSSSQ